MRSMAFISRSIGPNDSAKIDRLKKKKYGMVKKWWDNEAAMSMIHVEGLQAYRKGFTETELKNSN